MAARPEPALDELHAAPGNPGIAALGQCHPVRADDGDGPARARPRRSTIDLVVIGPEAPLVAGVADTAPARGIAVFGPSAEAARIEGSKAFAKDVLRAAGVPTAETLAGRAAARACVKADGLAAGKGVFVCHTQEELDAGARAARGARRRAVVIEELLEGEEVSLFALRDGERARRRSRRRRTSSGSATATRARTPAAWAPYSPVPGLGDGGGRGARRDGPPAGARASSPPRDARSSGCSTPA